MGGGGDDTRRNRGADSREAIVVGAGPAGLSVAATLGLAGIDAVVVERADAVGAAWRTHYERLHLHTARWLSHLPAYPIPRRFGRWVSRDGVVAYLEEYARHHRLDVRLRTPVERIERAGGSWRLRSPRGDLMATYIVVASGHNHTPTMPDWPGMDGFTGELLHAKEYRNAESYRGRDVLVVGAGNTGAEIAVELVERGAARVRMAIRTPPNVVPRQAAGLPGQAIGIAVRRLPPRLADALIRTSQRAFIGDLTAQGLPFPEQGVYTRLLDKGGLPILDIGLADHVRKGSVEVVPAVEGFEGADVLLAAGSRIAPDAVIAATGYRRGLDPLVGHLGLLGSNGRPIVHGPYTHPHAPRLHFIGFSDPISGMFREINMDAWKIARAVSVDRETPPPNITHRPGPLGARVTAKLATRRRQVRHLAGLRVLGVWLAALLALAALATPAGAAERVVEAGDLSVRVSEDPWRLTFVGPGGRTVLAEHPGTGPGPTGTLGFRAGGVWRHATRVLSARREGRALVLGVATTDPLRRLRVRLAPDGRGVISLEASVTEPDADVGRMGIAFRAREKERYLGFGERSNAIDQRGNLVHNYVEEGPYQDLEYPFVRPFIPPWGIHHRRDATYFPMPWLLSTTGYGVLVDNTETSRFRLATERPDAWSLEVDRPDELRLRVFAGPEPRDVVRRLTERVGRQPEPAAPWVLAVWFQPDSSDVAIEQENVRLMRGRDVPVSVTQQSLHYLPCGDQVGRRPLQRERTSFMHGFGLAMTAYVNPMICVDYQPVYDRAREAGVLTESPAGTPSTYTYQDFVVGQFDFTAKDVDEFYGSLLSDLVEDGYDGWMEDFGEYTPPQSRSDNGQTGHETHNVYPRRYHCTAHEFVRRQDRPTVTFIRSGWTGVHPCAQLVWGGDPTSSFGFDGLASAVRNGLTMGLSGISLWGSDIGGFFELTTCLTREELKRWIEFGAVSGFFETRARGIDGPPGGPRTCGAQADPPRRPLVTDPAVLPLFRRYAKLRTQLYPYIAAGNEVYRETGLPLMRHLALVYPDDRRAIEREDQFLFGPDLLAAPVLTDDARERTLYLPRGEWVDFWRAVDYQEGPGSLRLGRADVVDGGRSATVPAPLDELPLMVLAGAILPLLPPGVDTLADYPSTREDVVTLDEVGDRLDLLAFPRGRSTQELIGSERIVSRERGAGRSDDRRAAARRDAGSVPRPAWTLRFELDRVRRFELQASLATLERPFIPCRLLLDGEPLAPERWSYDAEARVLRARFETGSGTLSAVGPRRAEACGAAAAGGDERASG